MSEIHDGLGILHAKSKIQTVKTDFNREITKRGISRPKADNHPFTRDFSGERFHRTICRVFFVGNAELSGAAPQHDWYFIHGAPAPTHVRQPPSDALELSSLKPPPSEFANQVQSPSNWQ
jgi:hypothetical protein